MKQRVVSAIIAIIIVTPLIILGGIWFDIGILLISCLGLKELINIDNEKLNIFIKILSYISLILITLNERFNIGLEKSICLSTILLFLPIVFYDKDNYNFKNACIIFSKTLFLGFVFSLIRAIRVEDIWLFLFLFVIAATTDTVAYIIGSKFGKKRICPKVSPKKTLEGSISGTLSSIIVSTIFYIFFVDPAANILITAFVVLILSIIGQLGDLFFSQIKRYFGVKDFSNIMPGHGGILDRLDSLIFITICFTLISNIL